MAKKSTTPKTSGTDVLSSASKTASTAGAKPATAAAKKPAKATKAAPKASTPSTRIKVTAVTKPVAAAAGITPADIALRAYFIAEKRQKLGIPGDSTSDWVEAERQLKAEAANKAK
jgi:DsbC/DsbD-like thiol-disulfide interchange protein